MIYGVMLVFLFGDLVDAQVAQFPTLQACQVATEKFEEEVAASGTENYSVTGACIDPMAKKVSE